MVERQEMRLADENGKSHRVCDIHRRGDEGQRGYTDFWERETEEQWYEHQGYTQPLLSSRRQNGGGRR